MVTINVIEKNKNNIVKDLKPYEMEAYIKYLINVLYESFIEHDKERCLKVKSLIEETTKIFEKEGYSNSIAKELEFRLAKANSFLIQTLEDKHEIEVELTKVIVENNYYNDISKVIHDNHILKSLLDSYEKTPTKELASAIKDVIHLVESNLIDINFLLEEKEFTENNIYTEEVEILKEYYSSVVDLIKKINML